MFDLGIDWATFYAALDQINAVTQHIIDNAYAALHHVISHEPACDEITQFCSNVNYD